MMGKQEEAILDVSAHAQAPRFVKPEFKVLFKWCAEGEVECLWTEILHMLWLPDMGTFDPLV